MARVRYKAMIAVDPATGMPRPELNGQSGQIVAAGATTPVVITDDNGFVIGNSRLTITASTFVPTFWVEDGLEEVDWWDGTNRVPLDSNEGTRDAAKVAAAAAVAAAEHAQAALTRAEAAEAAVAAAPIAIPPGGTKGAVLSKASGAERDIEWRDVDGPIAAAAQAAANASQKGTQAIDAVIALEARVGDLEGAGPGPGGGVTVDQIEDATTVGKAVLKASSKANARSAIDAASVEDLAGKAPAEYRPPIYQNPTVPVPDGSLVVRFPV